MQPEEVEKLRDLNLPRTIWVERDREAFPSFGNGKPKQSWRSSDNRFICDFHGMSLMIYPRTFLEANEKARKAVEAKEEQQKQNRLDGL